MADIDTVKVKNPADENGGYMIINKTDFDPKSHELHPDYVGSEASLTGEEGEILAESEKARRVQANRGITGSRAAVDTLRNPSGTFSEPTPTDIRYPNKDNTEFENNHGAFIGKSASQMRKNRGIEDKPGGLNPKAHERVKTAEEITRAAAAEAAKPTDTKLEADSKADRPEPKNETDKGQ